MALSVKLGGSTPGSRAPASSEALAATVLRSASDSSLAYCAKSPTVRPTLEDANSAISFGLRSMDCIGNIFPSVSAPDSVAVFHASIKAPGSSES